MTHKTCIVVSFNQPDLFPPTLNAINELSKRYNSTHIITSHQFNSDWNYPKNSQILYIGKNLGLTKMLNRSFFSKYIFIIEFSLKLYGLIRTEKPDLIVLYDPYSALCYSLVRIFVSKKFKLWYHNHDILDKKYVKFMAPSWWAIRMEARSLAEADLFTLPSIDRVSFFKVLPKTNFAILPNYPSLANYSNYSYSKSIENENIIRILYQGRIDSNHGLEELLNFVIKSEGQFQLVLKGIWDEKFRQTIRSKVDFQERGNNVEFLEFTDYSEVPKIINTCQIGIGIHVDDSIMVNTIGTASNKIYEYIACGIPVILYDTPYFRGRFSQYGWAFFTDLTLESIGTQFQKIMENYTLISIQCIYSFNSELNFEKGFKKIERYI